MRRFGSTVALTLGVSLALVGCTLTPVTTHPETTHGQASESRIPTLLVDPHWSRAGDGAEVAGKLVVVNDTCFGLDNGTTVSTVIFANGTTVVDSSTISIPGVGRLELGDSFTGAGGTIGESFPGVKIPSACMTPEVLHVRAA
jgi:hypothetical protein